MRPNPSFPPAFTLALLAVAAACPADPEPPRGGERPPVAGRIIPAEAAWRFRSPKAAPRSRLTCAGATTGAGTTRKTRTTPTTAIWTNSWSVPSKG